MREVIAKLGVCLFFVSLFQGTLAQGVNFFDTDPAIFIQEVTNVLNQSKNSRGQAAAAAFEPLWVSGEISEEDKTELITQVNIMISKRYRTVPDLANYVHIYSQLRSGSAYVKIRPGEFLETTRSCILDLEAERVGKYLAVLDAYITEGYPIKRDKFYWHASSTTPQLLFLELKDGEGSYNAPVIRYGETNLSYATSRYEDSTLIQQTKGDFHLLSMSFLVMVVEPIGKKWAWTRKMSIVNSRIISSTSIMAW